MQFLFLTNIIIFLEKMKKEKALVDNSLEHVDADLKPNLSDVGFRNLSE